MKLLPALSALAVTALTAAGADFAKGLSAYEKGDYRTALEEWKPLAEEGDAPSEFNVGLLYYDGHGVPQDYPEAVRWFERASERGYTKAQHNLGAMYGVGKGVKRDYVLAYKWLSICTAAGDQGCESQRNLVEKKLSASKLQAAQRLARDWKPTPGAHAAEPTADAPREH
jgi:TPR repeat protein